VREDFETLVDRLDAAEPDVREGAVIGLARTNTVRAMAVLQKVVSQDPSVRVRYVAKKALWVMKRRMGQGQQRPGPTVILGLRPDTSELDNFKAVLVGGDYDRKDALLKMMVRHRLKGAYPLVAAAARSEKSPLARSKMVIVMGVLGGEEAVGDVADYLNDPDPRVRANAIEALEHTGSEAAHPLILPDKNSLFTLVKHTGRQLMISGSL